MSICNCKYGQGLCNTGSEKCTCHSGYFGSSCENECRLGFWGQNCKNRCNCGISSMCNPKDGSCHNEDLSLNGKI
jgi:hypothetical protein